MDAWAVQLRAVDLWVAGEPRVELIRGITWQVGAGEHWAVLGPNGAGKTSLLSLAAAERHPSRGTVEVLGERLGRTDMRALREHIAAVDAGTGARLSGRLALVDVVLTGLTGTVLPRPERYGPDAAGQACGALDMVGLAALAHRRFGDCSQGERQRALLARALVGRPRLLLLDEAAVGLDLPAREALLAAIASVAEQRPELTTITVTHHVEELAPSTTHGLLLRAGSAVAGGPIGEVLTDRALTDCFGIPIQVTGHDDRWSARARPAWRP
ncbi:MAG TPA: ATP-binding cassette domain-containing protein [Mycobacteriales bacterium]|nr:ATP-binding cassette domain-containing protein [Mycobacteriales bacterium]